MKSTPLAFPATVSNLTRRTGVRVSRSLRYHITHAWVQSHVLWIRRVWRRPFWFKDKFGIRMFVDPSDNLYTLFRWRHHFDDEGVLRLCDSLIQPGWTVVDVGANYGQFSVSVARRVGDRGRVYAVEPGRYAFQRLQTNIDRQNRYGSRIAPVQCAMCSFSGIAALHTYPPEYSFWNSLRPHVMWQDEKSRQLKIEGIQPTEVEEVRAVTLDEFCRETRIERIDLLKIDVEGLEIEVLQGAQQLVKEDRIGQILFEISLDPLTGAGHTPEEVLDTVTSLGFEIYHIGPRGVLERVDPADFAPPAFANYLARRR